VVVSGVMVAGVVVPSFGVVVPSFGVVGTVQSPPDPVSVTRSVSSAQLS
jgi:hypothetical protein